MGNSNGGAGVGHSKPTSPNAEQLGRLFESLAGENKCGQKVVDHNKFKAHFGWGSELKFGELLYQHIWDSKVDISKSEFIKTLEHFIQEGSTTHGKLQVYCAILSSGKTSLILDDLVQLLLMCWNFASHQENTEKCNSAIADNAPEISCVASAALSGRNDLSPHDLVEWISGHVPTLFDGIHQWTMAHLLSSPTAEPVHQLPHNFPFRYWSHDTDVLLTRQAVWLLSMLLPSCYHGNQPSQQASAANDNSIVNVWTLLYDCVEHGQSLNRFKHHCFSYRGPTLFVAKINTNTLIVMAIDTEWREASTPWGKTDCVLIQLQPQLKIFQGGSSSVFFNERARGVPQGLLFGPLSSPWLTIGTDLYEVHLHYRTTEKHHITKVEVWGCGGEKAKEFQQKQQKWERNQAEKSRKVKLPGKWDENPDKAILEMAGVRTSYSQR